MNRGFIFSMIVFVFVAHTQTVNGFWPRPPAGDPILIIPGIYGSRLYVNHRRDQYNTKSCSTQGKRWPLWVSKERFGRFDCFSEEMMLKYDRNTGQYSSTSDLITVEVLGFGQTYTVENLEADYYTFYSHPINYFKDFVQYFVDRDYVRGRSIRAAPYDWRLGPEELQRRGYYDDIKALIEMMCSENGNRKVTIVAHSMGAPIMLHFLTQSGVVTQEWKDQYIGNFIPIAGMWAGGNIALQYKISGLRVINGELDSLLNMFALLFELEDINPDPLRSILRSFESIHFLLPRPSVWGDAVLISTPARNYTASDYEQLFSDLRFTDGFSMYQGIVNINENFSPPNVPTHCFYGVGVDTPLSFRYTRSFPNGAERDPVVTMGDGDGTVNDRSSKICHRWKNNNGGHLFERMAFDEAEHMAILSNEDVLAEIGRIVGAASDQTAWKSSLFYG